MEILLQIILFVALVLLFIAGGAFVIYGLHYISWFHLRPCKHCGHHMDYKGLKDDEHGGHFLFHCTHCGAWEQIPKQEFFREAEKMNYSNPYNSRYDIE